MSAISTDRLEQLLLGLGLERLSKIGLILGVAYLLTAVSHFLLLPPAGRLPMFVLAATGAAAMLALQAWTRRHPESTDQLGPLTAVVYASIVAHSLGRLHYARSEADMMFVGVIAVGMALLPSRLVIHNVWLTVYLGGWSTIVVLAEGWLGWRPFVAPLVLAYGVSSTVRYLDLRRERRLLELQLLEGVRRREIQRQAHHDRLTGLGNRTLFSQRVAEAFAYARSSGERFAILHLDIDRFKIVNDSLGHEVGDQLLRALSRRLLRFVRPSDVVARFGGDEFAILLTEMASPEDALIVAERLRDALAEPFLLDGYEVQVEASIGIALHRPDYEDEKEMLRDADIAMGAAKASADKSLVFDGEMHDRAVERMEIEVDLRRALKGDELRLHYQPLVDVSSRRVVGFEALIRWQHPTRGLLGPTTFLPAAEDSGLIVPVGDWVLERACRDLARLGAGWRGPEPLHVGINLSAKQFLHEDFEAQLMKVIEEQAVAPESLWLEVTETTVLDRPFEAERLIGRLRRLGVTVCVDDFGVGYSSLGYLQRLSFGVLKLDRSFVADGPKNEAIVSAVVTLARGLDMIVVAEGIETPEQLARCERFGCEVVQGFLFDAALPLAEAEALLREGACYPKVAKAHAIP